MESDNVERMASFKTALTEAGFKVLEIVYGGKKGLRQKTIITVTRCTEAGGAIP